MTWHCQGQRRAGEECGLPPSCPHNNSRADTIDRKWSSELNIRAGWTQPRGEIWALEIRKGTTTKVAFSDLTAQSHITDGPGLHLHLDVHAQHMCTALDAPPKKESRISSLIILHHTNWCMNCVIANLRLTSAQFSRLWIVSPVREKACREQKNQTQNQLL